MKSLMKMILITAFAVCAMILPALGQSSATSSAADARPTPVKKAAQTVTVTIDDLKTFRIAESERNTCQAEKAVYAKASADWEASSKDWQSQFNQAIYRADVVQENRITQLSSAVSDKDTAITKKDLQIKNFSTQHQDDLERNADLEYKYRKAVAWNIKTGLISAGAGFAGGFYVGHKYADTRIVLTNSSGGLAGNPLASFSF